MSERGLNKVILIGRLGKDSEMRYTPNGKAVTTFSIACTKVWGEGDDDQKTEWVNCEAWEKRAETLAQYAKKGTRLYVEGSLRTTTSGEGDARKYYTKVVVDSFMFLGGGERQNAEPESAPADSEYSFGNGEEIP
jgi:single-strand DNA-binding protein